MFGWGCGSFYGGGLWGMGIQLLFWIVGISLLVYLFRKISSRVLKPGYIGEDRALAVLHERYARGEIDLEDYQMRKKELRG